MRVDDLTDARALSETACAKHTDTAADLADTETAEAVSFTLKKFPSPERVART